MYDNKIMLSTATLGILLASSCGCVTSITAAASTSSAQQKQQQHLPQHNIRSPIRKVPYPDYHPLSRHLRNSNNNGDFINDNNYDSINNNNEEEEKSRHYGQQSHKRKRRPITNNLNENSMEEKEEESIIEDKVLYDNSGEYLRYWTVTGRNLISSSTTSATTATAAAASILLDTETNNSENDQEDESSKLLMDVDQLLISNNDNNDTTEDVFGADSSSNNNNSDESSSFVEENSDETTIVNDEEVILSSSEAAEATAEATAETEEVVSNTSSTTSTSSSTSTSSNSIYKPIRLRAIFTDDVTSGFQYLNDTHRTILMEHIVNPALFAWSQALGVVPVGGGGSNYGDEDFDYEGDGGYSDESGSNGSGDYLVVDRTQLYDGESCGPGLDSGFPSVRVPLEHMTTGVSETDTVIYISVSFMNSNNVTEETSFDSSLPSLNLLHRSFPSFLGTDTIIRKGDNDNNETEAGLMGDSTEMPTLSPLNPPSFPPSEADPNLDSRPTCPGTYLASATHCSTDQYDRPVAGILSLCIGNVHHFFHNEEQIQRNKMAVMHEIGHILGFNAMSLAHFRNAETGEPLTRRDENGNVPNVEVECTGIAPTVMSAIPLPSENILQFQTVRGGVRVATVVTPTVQRVARNMFGCQTLLGAELQSGEGQETYSQRDDATVIEESQLSPGECIGDHWQRILYRKDLMNPVIDDVPHSLYISPLTLAYFKDSGWYDINYDRIAPVSMWGRNSGCNFADKTCITSSGHVQASNIPFFCSNLVEEPEEDEKGDVKDEEPKIHGCDVESSRKAVCSLVEYDEDIPPEFNYFAQAKSFPEDGIFGGKDPTLDYCPVFVGYANGRCDDKDAEEYAGVKSFEVFGEENSRCVMGHVDRRRTSLCLPIACVIQDQSLRIKVDGYWKMCRYSGQVISMWWNPNDYVVCPDPARMCPSFYCPHDCLKEEGGVCDYESGQCMCEEQDDSPTLSSTNTTNWLSRTYKKSLVPCSGLGKQLSEVNTTLTMNSEVERIDLEVHPEYYVDNATILLDEPKVFEDKVSRMFSQLTSGEVIALVASFVVFVLLSICVSTQFVNCYKRRLIRSSITRARSRMRSLPILRTSSRPPYDSSDDSDSQSSSPTRRLPGSGSNSQKDKMVANLLLQNRLELSNITSEMGEDDGNNLEKKQPTIANLSQSSQTQIVVNSSELPPLEEGRVLAVVENEGRVLAVVDDESQIESRYARSSATTATREHSEISEFTSPLYQDDEEGGGRRTTMRTLRLRRNIT